MRTFLGVACVLLISFAVRGEDLPAGLILKEAPAGAKDVSVLKKDAKEGDEVVIRGQVGGDVKPFVKNRAIVRIVDMKLPACNAKPGDSCKTPWDFCCETPEAIKANSATIECCTADGKPLKVELKGMNGIDHLSVVVVKGKVSSRVGDNLIIQASGIFVEKAAK
jgi:hypothetical protein